MTRHEKMVPTTLAHKRFVLATDLDGTFLGGGASARQAFYNWIDTHRDHIGLIFVTGRDPGFISDLTRNSGIPKPDYVVGDVGTTIAHVNSAHEIQPISALEAPIVEAWANASQNVLNILNGQPGLTLQPTPFRHRVSYDLDPAAFDSACITDIEQLGLDVLISDDRFLDVLPRGISKGPSLRRLLDHLSVANDKTLVAGDTLNDLSMLEMGLPAVAVGGSEAGLVARVKDLAHVHTASGIGVSGIVEAITTFNLFPQEPKDL
ncbi:MAG: HAD-IIB family hydrolase [Roseobacter sp.]